LKLGDLGLICHGAAPLIKIFYPKNKTWKDIRYASNLTVPDVVPLKLIREVRNPQHVDSVEFIGVYGVERILEHVRWRTNHFLIRFEGMNTMGGKFHGTHLQYIFIRDQN
jgi:hypothetical protein